MNRRVGERGGADEGSYVPEGRKGALVYLKVRRREEREGSLVLLEGVKGSKRAPHRSFVKLTRFCFYL